ncbi:putative bifunctional diguanylate cyclase/phosphodiesterase [Subtercola endophyticus]|uniref:putative bifunctional diguanylate cyclase/phosphodiesterase n=1 Tax=Subtercola endophyticus TaxID=2895559 RepID=UPI001E606679|nr:EAL domain-containing protein [Subtercola endophyticus]UFS59006.1 EAL domain-containing protein [Subtercola endophyticus]
MPAAAKVQLRTAAALPFLVFIVLVFLALALMPFEIALVDLIVPAAVMLVIVLLALLLPWQRMPGWTQAVPVLLFFVVIVLLRGLSDGATGFDPLVLLPVLWFALYGTAIEVALSGLATALVLIVPLLLPSGAASVHASTSDWVRALSWVACVVLIGPIIHSVARQWRAQERESAIRLAEVRESELRTRLLLEQMPDTILFVVDEDFRYQTVAGAGKVFEGALTWQGKTLYQVSNATNVAILERAFRSALGGMRAVVTINSTVTQLETEVTCVPFVRGDHPLALVVARDVTEARGRELALREVTAQFEQLVRESPTGMALADVTGRVALVNDAFCALFDSEPDALIESSATTLLPMISPHSPNWVAELISSGRSRTAAAVVLPTVGEAESKRAMVTAVVLRDSHGEATSVLINAHDTTEQHRYHEHVAYLASHDSLTGLVNRSEFERLVAAHLEACRWGGDAGAVLVLDLDNFREINDRLGHSGGDEFLVAMAGMLSRWIHSSDAVARIGGDEFAVLLTEGDRDEAEAAVQTLVSLVRDGFRSSDGEVLGRRVTASVGAVAVVSEATTAAELLSDADLAMYQAKNAGRNGYSFLGPSDLLAARVSNQINWTEKILAAIENDALVLHAQPILDLTTNTISSLELLVRMVDDDGSLIPPAGFIAVAESAGLAVMIDKWVVGRALEHLSDLQRFAPDIKVHVNLSGRSVGNLEFAEFIERRLAETGVDAGGLVLEVTETAAVSSIDAAQIFMNRLTALGCVFALDDFGVGYGSFYYLKHLPFGIVKLDGEFVSGSERDPLDLLVMSSLVSIGKGLGKFTVAEFVEDEASLTMLRELGVDGAQGYYIGRPAPLSEYFPQLA